MHENHGHNGTESNEPVVTHTLAGTESNADATAPAAPKAKAGNGMKWLEQAGKLLPTWDIRFKVAMVASFVILVTVLVANRMRKHVVTDEKTPGHAAPVAAIPKPTPKEEPKVPEEKPTTEDVVTPPAPTEEPAAVALNDKPKKDVFEGEAAKDVPPKPIAESTAEAPKPEPPLPDLLPEKKPEPMPEKVAETPPPIQDTPPEPVAAAAPVQNPPLPPVEPAKPPEAVVTPSNPAPVTGSGLNLTPTPPPTPPSTPAPVPEASGGTLIPIPFHGQKRTVDGDAVDTSLATPSGDARPLSGAADPVTHVVRRGENFFTISQRYYASGKWYLALWDANKDLAATPEDLYVGTVIRIPPPELLRKDLVTGPIRSKKGKVADLNSIVSSNDANATKDPQASLASQPADGGGKLFSVSDPTKSSGNLPGAASAPGRPTRYYVVKKENETLRSIANNQLGNSDLEEDIYKLNSDELSSDGKLKVGMKLKLPAATSRQ